MDDSFARGGKRGLGLLLAMLLLAQPVLAEERGWLTPRRAWGVALLGGSAVLLKNSWDFHQQASDFYSLYQRASTPQEAEVFFDRADNRDTKSQMSWMAATAFALGGVQLVAFGNREMESVAKKRRLEPDGKMHGFVIEPRVELELGRIGVRFKRRFF